jgi:hypothetical protein
MSGNSQNHLTSQLEANNTLGTRNRYNLARHDPSLKKVCELFDWFGYEWRSSGRGWQRVERSSTPDTHLHVLCNNQSVVIRCLCVISHGLSDRKTGRKNTIVAKPMSMETQKGAMAY